MIDLSKLQPIGRKQWTKRKWDEYINSKLAKAIKRSNDVYNEPTKEEFDCVLNKAKWKSTVDRKVNYLLARPPLCTGYQDKLDDLSMLLKESAKKYLLSGSLIWVVQGNGAGIDPVPMIAHNTIAVYSDENKQDIAAFIRRRVDIELEESTGEETEVEYYELYYEADGISKRETFCFSKDNADTEDIFDEAPLFIELGKTKNAPLFAYVEGFLRSFDLLMRHQDKTTEKNTDPLVEVRGYSGTSDEDLKYALETLNIARTDGTGGVAIHTRSMDSTSMDLWARRLMQEYYEATKTVGKEVELQYAVSGKAMDRLFIDMENDAREMAHVLEEALRTYFEAIIGEKVDIVWNTDRPVDDAATISAIAQSRGLVSDKTLLEQHPWVDDVDEEINRLEAQSSYGIEDLIDKDYDDIDYGTGEI